MPALRRLAGPSRYIGDASRRLPHVVHLAAARDSKRSLRGFGSRRHTKILHKMHAGRDLILYSTVSVRLRTPFHERPRGTMDPG
jgi:hypothetical protein